MPPTSTEDTMLEARPRRQAGLFADRTDDVTDATGASVFERCRSKFRQIGERMSSFDLSRQIYG